MDSNIPFKSDARISWYRPHVDKAVMAELVQRSDFRGYRQALGHLGLWVLTGTLAYLAFLQVSATTWAWSVPLLVLALFAHGTLGPFLGGVACHELGHKTVFKSKTATQVFLKIFSFFGWWDHVWFHPSHIKHHQLTIHHDYDGEVVLPQQFSFQDWQFWLGIFGWNPVATWKTLVVYFKRATGKLDNEWYEFVLPEKNQDLRHRHRNWARFCLIGHAALAAIFILTGHWFLIFIFNIGAHYCGWLGYLCGTPQHYGMQGEVPDHRLCCRTYISRGLPAFLYWNMQYHVEHHMFPGVPFFNLPKLRAAIEHDLPPAPVGLWATWREMLEIHRRQREDPDYFFVPELPANADGETALDGVLEREASGAA
jgi:fatty acid desaturase